MDSPLFLGLDLSTQRLKGVVMMDDLTVIHESAVHFDHDLAEYGTTSGSIRGPNGEVTTPVALWVAAIDLLLSKMHNHDVDFGSIVAVSGSAQVSRYFK